MSPFGHRHHDDQPAPARVTGTAIVLEPILPPMITNYQQKPVALAVELGDGRTTPSSLRIDGMYYSGVIVCGGRIPVTYPEGDPSPDALELDGDKVPSRDEVVSVIGEALGGPAVAPTPVDTWRVGFALQYAEQVIAGGAVSAAQADAIRTRIRAGV